MATAEALPCPPTVGFVEGRKTGDPNVCELYDPQENENLANKPGHAGRLKKLSAMLHKKLGSRR